MAVNTNNPSLALIPGYLENIGYQLPFGNPLRDSAGVLIYIRNGVYIGAGVTAGLTGGALLTSGLVSGALGTLAVGAAGYTALVTRNLLNRTSEFHGYLNMVIQYNIAQNAQHTANGGF